MKAYYNGRIFNGQNFLPAEYCVIVNQNRVLDILLKENLPSDIECIDLEGNILAPAFIDLQIYGGNGALFGEYPSVSALEKTYQYCLSGGATHFMPTVATNSKEIMLDAIQAVKDYWAQGGKGVLGLHLEGPYINIEKRGAHIKEFVKHTPSVSEIKELLEIGKGIIKIMTLAPEVVSDEVIHLLQEYDVFISMGHTQATYSQAQEAISKGIHLGTHLFNAMSPLQHRAAGVVGAIFDNPHIMTSIVADGYHVDFPVIRISYSILKERLFLITDAVTENPKGLYSHKKDGDKYTLADGTLSGSALTMAKAVKNCVKNVGIPLEDALKMASLYPAQAIKKENQLGKIEKGYKAYFVILNNSLDPIATIK